MHAPRPRASLTYYIEIPTPAPKLMPLQSSTNQSPRIVNQTSTFRQPRVFQEANFKNLRYENLIGLL